MSELASQLPACRCDLVIRPLGGDGRYVVKDPCSGGYFQLGVDEHFLLSQLDGRRTAADVCQAYEQRFGQSLGETDLDEFIELTRGQGLLESAEFGVRNAELDAQGNHSLTPHSALRAPHSGQSLLYWRKTLLDPDRFFTWLEPRIQFFWTRSFLMTSAGCIVFAVLLVWANRLEVVSAFQDALRWDTALLAWLTVFVVATLHECAHGLTCKHHGGEVHEIGFLLLFFMPGFYCNVSDAWLFREKSKRLWVTLAGGYFELFLCALAVFVWRVTVPESLVNRLAFVVLSVCGVHTVFNLNPLLKLDGYYLLSDLLEAPNLHQSGLGYLKSQLRWLLWGAPRPPHEPRHRLLLAYGVSSWTYAWLFLVLSLVGLWQLFSTSWGPLAIALCLFLGFVGTRGLLHEVSAGEVNNMIRLRHRRVLTWLGTFAGLAAFLCFVEMEDHADGTFQLRTAARAELRAPVAAFLQEVYSDEGDQVSPGAVVARLDIPDLASRLAQKQAEVREAEAKLRLLEAGSRPEEVVEQRSRVERAETWHALAQQDLQRSERALEAELVRLEKHAAATEAELNAAQDAFQRAKHLWTRNTLTEEQYREAERKLRVCQAQREQADAARRACEAKGTLEAEAELARRARELADAQAALRLLEAGTRPEEIAAERARLACCQEEASYLERLGDRLVVTSPVRGIVTTPRLRERPGQYLREGELIAVVEEPASSQIEITLPEQEVARVQADQRVALKARVLLLRTFQGQVDRLAPVAGQREEASGLTVYANLLASDPALRPGMTGAARIYTGRRPVGVIAFDRIARLVRTEFWLWW